MRVEAVCKYNHELVKLDGRQVKKSNEVARDINEGNQGEQSAKGKSGWNRKEVK